MVITSPPRLLARRMNADLLIRRTGLSLLHRNGVVAVKQGRSTLLRCVSFLPPFFFLFLLWIPVSNRKTRLLPSISKQTSFNPRRSRSGFSIYLFPSKSWTQLCVGDSISPNRKKNLLHKTLYELTFIDFCESLFLVDYSGLLSIFIQSFLFYLKIKG